MKPFLMRKQIKVMIVKSLVSHSNMFKLSIHVLQNLSISKIRKRNPCAPKLSGYLQAETGIFGSSLFPC